MDAPAAESGKVTQAAETIDPKYKLTEPTALSAVDRETYKRLRDAAIKGDTNAMLNMSEMTRKGQVADKGAPYFSYWLVQTARLVGQQATRHLKSVCTDNPDKRLFDKRFDKECSSFKVLLLALLKVLGSAHDASNPVRNGRQHFGAQAQPHGHGGRWGWLSRGHPQPQ